MEAPDRRPRGNSEWPHFLVLQCDGMKALLEPADINTDDDGLSKGLAHRLMARRTAAPDLRSHAIRGR